MLRILKETHWDFMKARKFAYVFSALLLLAGFVSMAMKGGPRTGIDFSGGLLLELRFSQAVRTDDLRAAAAEAGLAQAEIQTIEGTNDALFRVGEEAIGSATRPSEVTPAVRIQRTLESRYPGIQVEILRQELVGPKVGRELRGKALMAIMFSVIAIMIYVTVRFHRWEFGLGAAIALFHDLLVTLGIFSMLDKEIGLTVLAAFLTIAGYSINDSIVVFDRVRENMGLKRKMPLYDLINLSLNQTLSRTIITGLNVIMTTIALFVLGGPVIHDFALAMLIGLIFGTYSSVYVASALALDLDNWRRRRAAARAASRDDSRKTAARVPGAPKAAASKSSLAS